MNPGTAPKLAPPGAGLPRPELLVARLLFALRRRTGTPAAFTAHFLAERQAVGALIAPCDAATGARRVLIQRLRGLEDSSRNWSVWMTLDHLRIVHLAVAEIITALKSETVREGTASTAAVKPSPAADIGIIGPYEASCDALLATVAGAPDLKTRARFAHPWFGPLDAAGWHALAGIHLRIHRVQLERIFGGLATAGT